MRPETNKEMDLLLRRLGRRDGAIVPDTTGDHLDADELSAYAENAVPAAARSRYTAHLVECTRCRELVVQLSSSAGVVAAAETATVSKASVLKTFLASLFTPMVLRYAAPALGLIIIAAIGFMVLRQDRAGTDYVTQVTTNEQRPTPVPTAQAESRGLINPTNDNSPAAPTPSAEAQARDSRSKKDLETEAAPAPNAAPVVTVQSEVAKDASAAQPKLEQQPAAANEAPPPKPAPTVVEEKRKETAATTAAAAPATESQRFRVQGEDRIARKAGTPDSVGPQTGTGSVAGLHGERQRMSEKDESAEARSVAGRRFRKQRGIWIDTAYDSSRDIMTVTRGSESYRALIADEPEIKRIADELYGEIIVVWKSRVYRIR